MVFERVTFNTRFGINSASANGLNLGGSVTIPGGNTSKNYFLMCQGETANGIGLLIDNADNCNFFRCNFVCGSGGAFAVEIRGNGASGTNHFYNLTATKISGGQAIKLSGIASGYPNNTLGNSFWMSDNGNGTLAPLADAGCTFAAVQDNGFASFPGFSSSAFGEDRTRSDLARANIGTASVAIANNSSNHMRLVDGAGNQFGVNINGANGNMRITRVVGTGNVEVTGSRLIATYLTPSNVFAASGGLASNGVAFVDASGGNRTISLPLSTSFPNNNSPLINVVRIDASSNTVTIARQGSDTLNGGVSETLAPGQGKTYVCDPGTSSWYSF
jgi:hypothetical protein